MSAIEIACTGADAIPYDELSAFQGNLKTLPQENYEKLKREILADGFSFAIHVWRDGDTNHIIDGHQRLATVTEMVEVEGHECPPLPVVYVEAGNLKQAKRKVLAGTSQYGVMTSESLKDFALESDLGIDDLTDFRFPEFDLKPVSLLAGDDADDGAADKVPDVAENIHNVKRGDIWLLGEHRVMCGDSTDRGDVDKLMGGEKADMVFTDPPYGGNSGGLKPYTGEERKRRQQEGKSLVYRDKTLQNDKEVAWLANCFPEIPVKDEATKLVFFKWDAFEVVKNAASCWGNPSALLVWNRLKRANNFFRFQPQHELCFHWGNQSDKRAKSSLSNVFSIEKDERDIHPTVKPIALLEPIIEVCSSSGESIVDPFLGSGSTLIACEKTGRKCYGMEIDPHYCSVIIERWQQFTGFEAELVERT